MVHDLEIDRLTTGVETKYETEPIGEGELFLERFAQMELTVSIDSRLTIFFHRLGKEMPSVTRRDDANAWWSGFDPPFECSLEFAKAEFSTTKGKIIAEDQKRVLIGNRRCAITKRDEKLGEFRKIISIDLDDAQPLSRITREKSSNSGRLSRTPFAMKQHIVEGESRNQLTSISIE